MNYFLTGITGFIGGVLSERLLARPDATLYALVRPQSVHKLDRLRKKLGDRADRLVVVHGDLTEPALGVSEADRARLAGRIDHFFHVAAIYDLAAPDRQQ